MTTPTAPTTLDLPVSLDLRTLPDDQLAAIVRTAEAEQARRHRAEAEQIVRDAVLACPAVTASALTGRHPVTVEFGVSEWSNGFFYDTDAALIDFGDRLPGLPIDLPENHRDAVEEALATLSNLDGPIGADATLRLRLPVPHPARPCDCPSGNHCNPDIEGADCCKDCGQAITWIGPEHSAWEHIDA